MNQRSISSLLDGGSTRATSAREGDATYERRRLTYSTTFRSPTQRAAIRLVELLTAKPKLHSLVKEFEKRGPLKGQEFWHEMLDVMGISCMTPVEQLTHIPMKGATIVVANHPHGLVDGLLLAEMIGRRRSDYRILTRSILTGIDEEASKYMISVPFPHEEDAHRKMIKMRSYAMEHLASGGIIALFPSGVVASSEDFFGPPIEKEWNVFTAKMIKRSGAAVVPVYFQGANSRAYQIASQLSSTIRQGLLLYEIVRALNKDQFPIVGPPICPTQIENREGDPRALVAWLRSEVLSLRDTLGKND